MSKYRIHFHAIQHAIGGGKSTATDSVTVEAESESTAILLATNRMKTKSIYKGREFEVIKIDKL